MSLFASPERPSRIFAFVESKYSAKIEGIYTGLFEMINTGGTTDEQKSLKPLVELLLSSKKLDYKTIKQLSDVMNITKDSNKRFDKDFGVYKGKQKIYEPPLDKQRVTTLLKDLIKKTEQDENIIEIIHSHIIFEKVHPFIDSNGRIGRLLFQKAIIKSLNFSKTLPLSNFIFRNKQLYYESLDITNNASVDKGVRNIISMLSQMCERIDLFVIEASK
ncbi:MAG: Fic family protein [Chlamydiia bacterium]|nr:Fic family protein [Chlamydiia bacterium]